MHGGITRTCDLFRAACEQQTVMRDWMSFEIPLKTDHETTAASQRIVAKCATAAALSADLAARQPGECLPDTRSSRAVQASPLRSCTSGPSRLPMLARATRVPAAPALLRDGLPPLGGRARLVGVGAGRVQVGRRARHELGARVAEQLLVCRLAAAHHLAHLLAVPARRG